MKYLKRYNELNEGLRDKMSPKSEEDVLKSLENLPTAEKIENIIKHDLDYDLLPRDKNGWCVYNLDYVPYYYENYTIPNKFKIIGSFYASNATNLEQLPDELYVSDDLVITHSKLTELPSDLFVGGHVFINNNQITKLPDNFTVNGILNVSDNKLKKLPKGLTVERDLIVTNNQITKLPDDLIVKGTLYIDSELKDTINKPIGVTNIKYE